MQRAAQFRLVTLGRLSLTTLDGATEDSLEKRRRKLAVLAVLAVERRPIARDMLLEMFWGDQPEERARHSLSDALSHLRRVLGRASISLGRGEIVLDDRALLEVDAQLFRAALADGDPARAVQLYGGPFLDGVYVGGSPAFEHWVDRHRSSLHSLLVDSCRSACASLRARGESSVAATIAERWLHEEPLSNEALRCRLTALRASGTQEALLATVREYERHAGRMKREFGVEPPPDIAAIAAEAAELSTVRPVVSVVETTAWSVPPAPNAPAADASPVAAVPLSSERMAGRGWRWMIPAAVVALAAIGLVRALPSLRTAHADALPDRIAILPFAVRGGSGASYLREGMVDLLSTSLDGAGSLTTTDPRAVLNAVASATAAREDSVIDPAGARRIATGLGAGRFILGTVVEAGGRLRMSAALYGPTAGEPRVRAEVEGTSDELFALVDGLTAQLVAGTQQEPGQQLARIAALTTHSLPALKAYLAGEQHFRAAKYTLALEDYQRAAASDSTFPLAHYRLSLTHHWAASSWDSIFVNSRRAVRDAARLSARAQLIVQAHDAWRRGANDEAERLYRLLTTAHPDDVEGWHQLGEVLFHANALRGRSFREARLAFERTLALEPGHTGAMAHLVRIAGVEERDAERDSLVRRLMAIDTAWAAQQSALQAFTAGDAGERAAALATLRRASDLTVWIAAERVGVVGSDLTAAEEILRLLIEPRRTTNFQLLGNLLLGDMEAARGRWGDARQFLQRAEALDSTVALERQALLASHPFLRVPRAELEELRAALRRQTGAGTQTDFPNHQIYNGVHPILREYLIGLLDLRLGELGRVDAQIAALDRLDVAGEPRAIATGFAHSLRGHLLAARGRREEALAELERGRLVANEGFLDSPIGSQALDRWQRAELLRELGRDDDALRWYQTLSETSLSHQLYRAPAALRVAEIEERHGRLASAAAHYGRFVQSWEQSEPALEPEVDRARARLLGIGPSR